MAKLRQMRFLAATGILPVLLACPWLPMAGADVLTFEDLPGIHQKIPNGYGGLNWQNAYLYSDASLAYSDPQYALVSWLYNTPLISSNVRFDLQNLRISSSSNLTMDIYGYRGGVEVYRSSWLYPNQYGQIRPTLNWTDIDTIGFGRIGGNSTFALDDLTYTRHATPNFAIHDDFPHGATLGGLGYLVVAQNATGLAEIIIDPQNAGNALMRMFDSSSGAVSVRVAKAASLTDGGAAVEFDYRFLTTGKLNVLIGDVVVDTIVAPATGDGSPGSVVAAHYSATFSLSSAGLTPGDLDVGLELVNDGDPELYLDNLQVTSVIPEPMGLSLLAVGVLAIFRRRR